MSIKDLTKEKHREAENTPFMRSVFAKTLPAQVWTYWTFNKMHWYNVIETRARDAGFLDNIIGLERTYKLYQDFKEMSGKYSSDYFVGAITEKYCQYLLDLPKEKILAHLYVWHFGDLYGGQQIRNILSDVPHRNLDFSNAQELIASLRPQLSDDLAEEANIAFDWAILLMSQFVIDGETTNA